MESRQRLDHNMPIPEESILFAPRDSPGPRAVSPPHFSRDRRPAPHCPGRPHRCRQDHHTGQDCCPLSEQFFHSIALITIDTYRIAAVEQLKVYGAIMNLPVEVVITPEQLEQASSAPQRQRTHPHRHSGTEPERHPLHRRTCHLSPAGSWPLTSTLSFRQQPEKSSFSKPSNDLSGLGINNTIITKTDECSTLGVMLDIQMTQRQTLFLYHQRPAGP